jgi:Xaa-Pro aminopeptidase
MAPWATVDLLRGQIPGVQFRNMSRQLDDLKVIYSPEELELLRAATKICDYGMEKFIELASVGRSELAVAGEAGTAMSLFAAKELPDTEIRIQCYSQQGLRTLEPHTSAKGTPIELGNLMCVVIETYAWNYQAAVERTVAFGTISDDAERLYQAIISAHRRAIETVAPGTTLSEVDRVARDVFFKAGFEYVPSGSGCGRGLLTEQEGRVDQMNLRPYNNAKLRPEMVFTVEPFAVAEAIGAPRHCDMVRVTNSGHEVISRARAGYIRIS